MRKRFAPVIVERSTPSMLEICPPVTREMMFETEVGPEKVALPFVGTLNSPKLWKRFPPACRPRSAVTE